MSVGAPFEAVRAGAHESAHESYIGGGKGAVRVLADGQVMAELVIWRMREGIVKVEGLCCTAQLCCGGLCRCGHGGGRLGAWCPCKPGREGVCYCCSAVGVDGWGANEWRVWYPCKPGRVGICCGWCALGIDG